MSQLPLELTPGSAAELKLVIYGAPAPQGSKTGFLTALFPAASPRSPRCPGCKMRLRGQVNLVESTKGVKEWRAMVTAQCRSQLARVPGWQPLAVPLVASMTFTIARAAGHFRSGKYAALLAADAPDYPVHAHGAKEGDTSKLLRATEDALTDGGLWADDSLVVWYEGAGKFYVPAEGERRPAGFDVLGAPGVVIRVRPFGTPPPVAGQA